MITRRTLTDFVSKCDVVIHLAAVNRHHNQDEIYDTNLLLVEKLINAHSKCKSNAHIIFASSTQEERDNVYGRSKKESREKLAAWAKENKSGFTGLIIPNVFGPFGKPFYNSVISTFSYQLCTGEMPKIEIDAELKLIYVDELIAEIKKIIEKRDNTITEKDIVQHTFVKQSFGYFRKAYFI